MEKKIHTYKEFDDDTMMASEPALAMHYQAKEQNRIMVDVQSVDSDAMIEDKITFLRSSLSTTTADYLDSVEWMIDKPFPCCDIDDAESWIDEAERTGDADVVDASIVKQDYEAWHNLR